MIPAGQYTADINSDDGFRLRIPGVTFTNRVGENFTGATNPSPADTPVYGGTRGASNTLAAFTVPAGGLTTMLTLDEFEHNGGDEVEFAVANGQQSTYSATAFSLLGNGVLGWQVLDPSGPMTPIYTSLIGTNLQPQMFNTGKNSAYIRIPFTVANPATLGSVRFQVKYDDGFVAYLNGLLVAQRNAPNPSIWSSSASSTHPDVNALNYETISIPTADLTAGNNVLAIQGLNSVSDQSDFLIYPILNNLIVSLGAQGYLQPTPGAAGGQAIAQGLAAEPTFDHAHGFYNQPFQLAVSTTTPGAQIRYTLDGSAPTATNGAVYTGPITISWWMRPDRRWRISPTAPPGTPARTAAARRWRSSHPTAIQTSTSPQAGAPAPSPMERLAWMIPFPPPRPPAFPQSARPHRSRSPGPRFPAQPVTISIAASRRAVNPRRRWSPA